MALEKQLLPSSHYWRDAKGRVQVSPTYESWRKMKSRCYNPKCSSYKRYGGVGIKVSEAWKVFANFLYDMGPRPKGTTLDRVDSSKGYNKNNCRWADAVTQSRNRRTVRLKTDSHRERIRLLAEAGTPGHQIDKLLGLSRGRSGQVIREMGWKRGKIGAPCAKI